LQRVLFLLAIIIPFDIRDVNADSQSLKTLPQVVGIKKAKIIGYILLFLFIGLECLKSNLSMSIVYILFGISLVTGLFIKFTSVKQSRYYTGFWVEAIPIIWLGLFMLFLGN